MYGPSNCFVHILMIIFRFSLRVAGPYGREGIVLCSKNLVFLVHAPIDSVRGVVVERGGEPFVQGVKVLLDSLHVSVWCGPVVVEFDALSFAGYVLVPIFVSSEELYHLCLEAVAFFM